MLVCGADLRLESYSYMIPYAVEGCRACSDEVDEMDKLLSSVCCTRRHRDGCEVSMRR